MAKGAARVAAAVHYVAKRYPKARGTLSSRFCYLGSGRVAEVAAMARAKMEHLNSIASTLAGWSMWYFPAGKETMRGSNQP